MEKLINVQINIVLSILLIIILVHAYRNMNKVLITSRLFMCIMGITYMNLSLEILDVYLSSYHYLQYVTIRYLINLIGFIIAPCVPYLGYCFMKEWMNRFQRQRLKDNKIFILPLIINCIVSFASFSKFGAFYITQDNIYHRGPLFIVLPIVSYFYFAFSLYNIFLHRKKIVVSEQILFSSFYIAISIFTAVQIAKSTYFTIWNTATIICIVIYIFILNDQAYRDALTGLSNRMYYERYVQNFNYKKEHDIVAVYIDLDKFKTINDQYGHCEGDDAIRIFANMLKEIFYGKKMKLMRVGGDEFLILIKNLPQQLVEDQMELLVQKSNSYNRMKEKPYELEFSYGIARYDNTYDSISHFFEHTDLLMYGNKRKSMKQINNFS